jgi:hypothetical protein
MAKKQRFSKTCKSALKAAYWPNDIVSEDGWHNDPVARDYYQCKANGWACKPFEDLLGGYQPCYGGRYIEKLFKAQKMGW